MASRRKISSDRSMRKHCIFLIYALAMSYISHGAETDYLSPVALASSPDGKTIYVAEHTAKQIAVFDTAANKVTKTIAIKTKPNGVAVSKDGSLLYVTDSEPEGKVYVIDAKSGKTISKIDAGHTPMSPVESLDGKTLFVCNRFNNNVGIIDLAAKKLTATVPVTREPVAAVLAKNGTLLYVANHLPTGAANVDYMTSAIDVIDTATRTKIKSIALPNGAIDLRAICASKDGKYIYVPSILARFLVPTTQIERGWINTHALNIIDANEMKLLYTILLDNVDLGAANPWGIDCTDDGKYICVAHSATHEVSLIDQAAMLLKLSKLPTHMHDKSDKIEYEASSSNPANDLSFLAGIRKRVKLGGNGPRGLIVTDSKVYTTEYFSDSLGMIDPYMDNVQAKSIPLGPHKDMNIVRKGEMFFNDASLCFQQWQSCSTCHPDVRTDAVNWDLLNDGIGNPKSTKSLLFSHKTPPVMISGIRPDAETAVRAGIRYIQFAVPTDEKSNAIDAYLKSVQSIPSPYLLKGKLSKKAKNGARLFKKADCMECHSGELHTDMLLHDVGTGEGIEEGREFDTPTLVETWRTAPYLYDGRAATMKEVFTKYNKEDQHGVTSKLKEGELDELVEYVLSL